MTTIDALDLAGASDGADNPVVKGTDAQLIRALKRFAKGKPGARNSVIGHVVVLGDYVLDLKKSEAHPSLNGKTIAEAIWPK
jgi:hypothetical protein